MPFRRFASALLPIVVPLLAAVPVAQAQPAVCTVTGEAGATPVFDCELTPCESPTQCSAERFGAAVCDRFVPLLDGAVCRPRCATLFGCMADSECPRLLLREGTCVIPESRPEGFDPIGVCVYADVQYCRDGITAEDISDCHTTPDGAPTSSWLFGDCDEDGCPNGRDRAPCEDSPISECGSITLGEGECVAPIPEHDAGVPEVDAGITEEDAEVKEDAGVVEEIDAGSEPFDAGSSSEPPPGIGFNGGGGCRCAVPGGTGERPVGGLAALTLVLGALLARRRAR